MYSHLCRLVSICTGWEAGPFSTHPVTAFVQGDLLKDVCTANSLGRQKQCPLPGQREGLFSDQNNVNHVFLEHTVGILRGVSWACCSSEWHSSGIHQDLLPHGPRGTWDKGTGQTKLILSVMLWVINCPSAFLASLPSKSAQLRYPLLLLSPSAPAPGPFCTLLCPGLITVSPTPPPRPLASWWGLANGRCQGRIDTGQSINFLAPSLPLWLWLLLAVFLS